MNEALAWVGQIAGWIGRFIPRWEIIPATHAGVKFVRGHRVVPLAPGIHWWWPVTTTFERYPVVRQATNLRAQTMETKDGITIAVSALIVYEVHDIADLIARTFEADNTIGEVALTATMDVLHGKTWDEIRGTRRSTLNNALRKAAERVLEPYGVTVLGMALTDLARCRVFKVLTGTAE